MMTYEEEILDEDDDNGTMPSSRDELAEAVVGHRIVNIEKRSFPDEPYWWDRGEKTVITLDNGKEVLLGDTNDCCAYTELESFLINYENIDHIITGVGTTDSYHTWHIYADAGDVVKMQVGWSPGNPFYYGYGFNIMVKDIDD